MRKFDYLKEFALETWRKPFPIPGSLHDEQRVVEGWAAGDDVPGSPGGGHATLCKISLRYGSGKAGVDVLSCWSKVEQEDGWNRDSSVEKGEYEPPIV